MKRVLLLGVLVSLLAAVGPGAGAPVGGGFVGKTTVGPDRAAELVKDFKGGERACVVITGKGQSYLGLYVYDADGNCIARDDRGDFATRDDAAVEWYPPQTSRYSIVVKNLGARKDPFDVAVH